MENREDQIITVELYKTYYERGFFNISVDYERFFGENNEAINIKILKTGSTITGIINRTANKNGTPRIIGGVELKRYFRSCHAQGDIIHIKIVSKNSIEIHD
jgi:hypothetical protein